MRSQPASGKGMSDSAVSAGREGSRRSRREVAQKRWSFCDSDESYESITLSSVSFEISLADIYNKVEFEQVETEPTPEVEN